MSQRKSKFLLYVWIPQQEYISFDSVNTEGNVCFLTKQK